MICPECGDRWSPLRKSHWRYGDTERGEATEVPLTPQAKEIWQKDFDDDHKVVCSECRL